MWGWMMCGTHSLTKMQTTTTPPTPTSTLMPNQTVVVCRTPSFLPPAPRPALRPAALRGLPSFELVDDAAVAKLFGQVPDGVCFISFPLDSILGHTSENPLLGHSRDDPLLLGLLRDRASRGHPIQLQLVRSWVKKATVVAELLLALIAGELLVNNRFGVACRARRSWPEQDITSSLWSRRRRPKSQWHPNSCRASDCTSPTLVVSTSMPAWHLAIISSRLANSSLVMSSSNGRVAGPVVVVVEVRADVAKNGTSRQTVSKIAPRTGELGLMEHELIAVPS